MIKRDTKIHLLAVVWVIGILVALTIATDRLKYKESEEWTNHCKHLGGEVVFIHTKGYDVPHCVIIGGENDDKTKT